VKSDSKIYQGPLDPRTIIGFYHADLVYADKAALQNISFNLANGEFVCLTGPSGAGKSSILRLIAMDALPTKGQVIVRGMLASRMNRRRIPQLRREIGFVFQDFRLLEDRSVLENVAFAQLIVGVPKAAMQRNVMRVLTQVGLWDKRNRRPRTLSGGEQQRVAIARAIAKRPQVLLCDEPTGALDSATGVVVLEALDRINREIGTTTVVITHNAVVANMADRVLHLSDGVISRVQMIEDKVSPREMSW